MTGNRLLLGFAILLVGCCRALAQMTDAEEWRSYTPGERSAYIWGFRAGVGHGSNGTSLALIDKGYIRRNPSKDVQLILKDLRPTASPIDLANGVSKLYEDPANAYVAHSDALLIAWDRLRGRDVEKRLQEARKEGYEIYESLRRESK